MRENQIFRGVEENLDSTTGQEDTKTVLYDILKML